jgi:hypothetical protein
MATIDATSAVRDIDDFQHRWSRVPSIFAKLRTLFHREKLKADPLDVETLSARYSENRARALWR